MAHSAQAQNTTTALSGKHWPSWSTICVCPTLENCAPSSRRNNRFSQLLALALASNEDAAECALGDLFREFPMSANEIGRSYQNVSDRPNKPDTADFNIMFHIEQ